MRVAPTDQQRKLKAPVTLRRRRLPRIERVKPPAPRELTPRQRETLQLLAEGHSTREIAVLLNVNVKTVETHRVQLKERLGIFNVADLVRYALRIGLISAD
jgi:DNA-binding CsgD family transcriptional regulator